MQWKIQGYKHPEGEPVCAAQVEKPVSVNALFSSRKDLAELYWVYTAAVKTQAKAELVFAALSPFCAVYVDGKHCLTANNAFRPFSVTLEGEPDSTHQVELRFSPYQEALVKKLNRPRWKSAIAGNNHRAIRNTLLGSVEGWANDAPPIGVLGSVFAREDGDRLSAIQLSPKANEDGALLTVANYSREHKLTSLQILKNNQAIGHASLSADQQENTLALPDLDLWWPHTMGAPNLHDLTVRLEYSDNQVLEFQKTIGFKSVQLENDLSTIYSINGRELFVRGSCWTTSRYPTFEFDADKTRTILESARDLGLNMIRISGPMRYEEDAFYSLCDELGLLVWQDFPFANFDYPSDAEFIQDIEAEVTFQTQRLSQHASIATYCGNSEIQQQAVMVGQPLDHFEHPIFDELLPRHVAAYSAHIPYIPSSPSGGTLPFSTNEGFSHYFGYGAYKRSEEDLVISDVKFASECLGLSHLPSESFNKTHFNQKNPPTHLPKWKDGVCRDASTGWDFEDIRDFYLQHYFKQDPIQLRSTDLETYHETGRVLTGYMMAQAFNFWRSSKSNCRGAISWWLNDLAPGAGWGLLDSDGKTKPAAEVLKPQLQPIHISLIPQGLNGHLVSLINETDADLTGTLTIQCIQTNRNVVTQESLEQTLPAYSQQILSLNECFNRFIDSTYAYQFGSEPFDVIGVHFETEKGTTYSHAQFPVGLSLPKLFEKASVQFDIDLVDVNGTPYLEISTNKTIPFANISLKNGALQSNYLTLLPGKTNRIALDLPEGSTGVQGNLRGLNMGFTHRFSTGELA